MAPPKLTGTTRAGTPGLQMVPYIPPGRSVPIGGVTNPHPIARMDNDLGYGDHVARVGAGMASPSHMPGMFGWIGAHFVKHGP